ncbi:MAG: toxin-antitoxin system antitoxin subunit [Mediterranea sp.]|jgi:uncharacterized protein with HEPN domain|nr:toxin-antitoxin system antitoxin subunit [Mediterranea sp.]
MTDKQKEITERLKREFEVCDKHILRIHQAMERLGLPIPLSVDDYVYMNDEQIACVDQFIFRFSKLQDAMGAKIFRLILSYLGDDVTSLPMRDVLNRLERYELLPSVDEWIYLRDLRNDLAHDYPLLEANVVAILNQLFVKVEELISIYTKIAKQVTF